MSTTINRTIMITAMSAALMGCSVQAMACPENSALRLTAKENNLNLNDNAPVCIPRGANGEVNYTFHLKINPDPQKYAGQITIKEKDENYPVTISGTAAGDAQEIAITVEGNVPEGAEEDVFRYYVEVVNVGKLDPKVRVVDSNVQRAALAGHLYEFLKANGVSAEQAFDALREFRPDANSD